MNKNIQHFISKIQADNPKLRIWRAFSGIDASNGSSDGDLDCDVVANAALTNSMSVRPEVSKGGIKEIARDNNALRYLRANRRSGGDSAFTVGIKDIIDVAGLPTRNGSRADEHAPPATTDAACVALLRDAGAAIIGKTVTTELATFVPAETINPIFPLHTPGGSSCGSAAAVAAGHVDLALGTQTAGSILRPAAYCGVFGFKPTFGLVPRDGVLVQSPTLDTVGAFARDVETLKRWLQIFPLPSRERVLGRVAGDSASQLRFVLIKNWLDHASADMRDALVRAANALRTQGHEVSEMTLPRELDDIVEHQRTIQNVEAARAYERYRMTGTSAREHVTPALLEQLDAGAAISELIYQEALDHAEAARLIADDLLSQCDAWLMPAATGAPPLRTAQTTGDPIFNRLASVLGTPAISVPGMVDGAGLPLGLQLVAGRERDSHLLDSAREAQSAIALS